MTEVWRSIAGFDYYEVSNLGQVRTWRKLGCSPGRREEPRLLKPALDRSASEPFPYLRVNLWKNNHMTTRRVHALVLEAFVGTCPEGLEAAHLDGDYTNNRIDNLEWTTHIINCAHRSIHDTQPRGSRVWNAKLDEVQVREVLASLPYETMTSIAQRYAVSIQTIANIKDGKTWRHVARQPV